MNDEAQRLPKIPLSNEGYLSLWQFFENRADTLKDRIWTVFSFHSALLLSLFGFILMAFLTKDQNATFILFATIVGVLYSLFQVFHLSDLIGHLSRNEQRANNIKPMIIGLQGCIDLPGESKKRSELRAKLRKNMTFAFSILITVGFFFLLYLQL